MRTSGYPRIVLFFAIALGLPMVVFVASVYFWGWSSDRMKEGVERGSWLAASMPDMLNSIPAYSPCGRVIQRHEWRDGERPPVSDLYYTSSEAKPELLDRYVAYFEHIGCKVDRDAIDGSLTMDCSGKYLAEFVLTVTPSQTCHGVHASWWGGEE